MRRVILLVLVVMALVFSPVLSGAALAAPSGAPGPGGAASGTCGPDQIQLSVPLLAGGDCIDNNPASGGAIVVYLKLIIRFLSGAVGLVIMLMLVIAGVQYITSLGDPAMIKKAKERIINAITALMLFVLAYAIINYLIPGGILG